MKLYDASLNKPVKLKEITIKDNLNKIRLMELGLVANTIITIKRKSPLKHTMLVVFNYSCFLMQEDVCKNIEVDYV